MSDRGERLGDCQVIRETEKAILVVLEDDGEREIWIPKTQIHDDSEVWKEGQTGELIVKAWFAEKEGLA